jgi:hypothetical protein
MKTIKRSLMGTAILFALVALTQAEAKAWATAGSTTSTWLVWRGGW